MDKDGNEYSYFVKYDELGPVIACPGVDMPSLADSFYSPDNLRILKERLGIKEDTKVYMPSLADSAYSPDNLRILKEKLGISDRVEQKKCHNGNKVLTKRKD